MKGGWLDSSLPLCEQCVCVRGRMGEHEAGGHGETQGVERGTVGDMQIQPFRRG